MNKQLYGYGLVDGNNEPVKDCGKNPVIDTDREELDLVASISNELPESIGQSKAPYRVVKLFWVDQPEEEHF